MKSDISRDTFQSANKYSSVRMQQGRVLVDADWNEQVDIRAYQDRLAAADGVGESGAPARDAGLELSAISGGSDLSAAPGRYYIEGIPVETAAAVAFTAQAELPGYALPTEDGVYLAYAETREALITALEDPELRDPALSGYDTTTRSRSLLQLKLLRDGNVGDTPDCLAESPAWLAFRDGESVEQRARLKARLRPNETTGQAGEYSGEQNALYRVEIHRGGAGGAATFKWSRANAAEVLEWTAQNGDLLSVRSETPRRGYFAPGDWLELLDESFELVGRSGGLVQILADDGDTLRIKADSYIPFDGGAAALDISEFNGGLRKIRRWSMSGETGELTVPADPTEYIAIEYGLELAFTNENANGGSGEFRTGDAWLIPARAITRDIEWPVQSGSGDNAENDFAPPMFPRFAFARLAYVQRSAGVWSVLGDCRRIFPTLSDANLAYQSGDGQEGLPGEFLDEALVVRVASASVPICDARVRFTIVAGDGSATLEDVLDAANTGASIDVLTDAEGLAGVRWLIDPTTAQPRLEAALLDESGTPTPLLIRFNAGLSVAARLQHAPQAVPDPNGADLMAGVSTVREALDRLEAIKADRAGDTITGSLAIDEDLTVEGQLTVQGDVIAKDLAQTPGNVVLGDQDADRITVHGQLKSEHILDAVVVDDAMQIREDLLVDGAVGPQSGVGIGELTGDWKFRVPINIASTASGAPFSAISQQLYASDGATDDHFGLRVAVDGDWMLVGAPGESANAGAVYFHKIIDGRWVETQKAVASDTLAGHQFGYSVAIDGDTAVIGSIPDGSTAGSGRAYVFIRNGDTWVEIQQLFGAGVSFGYFFGVSVAIDGDYAIVGATGDAGTGAAYVFRLADGAWNEQVRIVPPGSSGGDFVGTSVAISGDVALIGAQQSGTAHVYRRSGANWNFEQALTASGGEAYFGIVSALENDRIVVGAPQVYDLNIGIGAAYVFDFNGTTWVESAKLVGLDTVVGDHFGSAVALEGDRIIVGAFYDSNDDGSRAGAAYAFSKSGANWSQSAKILPQNEAGADSASFGAWAELKDGVAYIGMAAAPAAQARFRAGSLAVVPETPDALIDYQQELTLNTAQLVAGGKMNADGSDILFMNQDDLIPLPYWIESGMNTAATKIWVRLPRIPAGGSTRIFLHYGNENAQPRSSTAETFLGEIEALGAAWQFEDGSGATVRDLSGNGNDGTIQGPVSWTDGRFGSALEFNGTSNTVALPAGNIYPASEIGSVSMWFYTDREWASLEVRTAWRFTAGAQALLLFWDRSGALSINMSFRNGRHVSVPVDLQTLVGRWNHLVCVYDGGDKNSGNSFRYYLNGVDIGNGTIDSGEVGDNFGQNDNVIGSDAQSGSSFQFWEGRLNHLQIFNRVLTNVEVAALYNNYGYATLEYPGRILLRTFAENAPVVSLENELPAPFALPEGWQYRRTVTIKNDFAETPGDARRVFETGSASTLLAPAGEQLLVGSFLDDGGVGAVYVMERDAAGIFRQIQKLVGSNLSAGDGFGGSIDVQGDVAVISAGAHDAERGAIYVFERANGVWYESARVVGPVPGERMSETVAIAGDYIFGGGSGSSTGTVRAFRKNASGVWTETQTLPISDAEAGDGAWQIAAAGDIALVSAITKREGGADNGGAAYVFRLNATGDTWQEVQKLVPADRSPADRFGIFSSVYETTLSIGADDDPNGNGAVYIFEERDGSFVETAKLTAPDGALRDRFGFRSHLTRDALITGSHFKHDDGYTDVGAVYLYNRSGSGWGPAIEIKPGEFGRNNLYFGYDSAIMGDSIVASTFPGTGNGEVLQFERQRAQSIDDVQLEIELDSFGLIADRKLRDRGEDLMITDEDGITPLPFYIAGGLNSRTTKIWTRVPGLRAGENRNVFLHYGNPTAASRSSANETFVRVIDGVAAAYTLDESAGTRVFDASGNLNDGIATGPVRSKGIFGGAFEFDGDNDYVQLRDDATVDIKADIALACWFRCDGPGTGTGANTEADLIAKHHTLGDRSYDIAVMHQAEPRLRFELIDTSDAVHALFSNQTIEYGRWYHAVGTYEKQTRELRLYIDGELDTLQVEASAFDLLQSSVPLSLGAFWASTTPTYRHFLLGALEEPRVYARSLSSEEVRDLYENRGDVRLADGSRSEFVRRHLPAPPLALPGASEEKIAYNIADEWSYRQAINIDNSAAASTNFTKLTAAGLDDLHYFGGRVFISDDFAFAGAVGDNDLGVEAGAVYVFRRVSTVDGRDRWVFDAKLTASDGGTNNGFSDNLAFDGTSLIATAQSAGRAYVFVRDGGVWTEQAILTPSAAATTFGYSAWIDGDLAVVADHSSSVGSTDAGAAYVFRRSGVTWSEEAILTHPNPSPSIFFGSAVSVSADDGRIAVGCRGDGGSSVNRGAVYLFDWDGSAWQRGAELVASDAANGDFLGESMGMSGNTIVAGAYLKNSSTGAAYVFRKQGDGWIQEAKLTASDGAAGDEYSVEIAISGDRIIVGARQPSSGPGKAYIVRRTLDGRWIEERILAGDNETTGFLFGTNVSISPGFALVGHRVDGAQLLSRGAAYLFELDSGETEVQLPLTIDTAALVAAAQVQQDCGDLMFTDTDGRSPLAHWIESGKNTADTKIWVKLPYLPYGETKTIYMHAGNPRARTRSSLADTFVRSIDGVIAAYDFDEDSGTAILDRSGNGFDGTLQAGASREPGKFGSAMALNGSAQYASLPAFPGMTDVYDFTVSIWGRLDTVTTLTGSAGRHYLFDFRGDGAETPDSIGLYLEHVGGGQLTVVSSLVYDGSAFSASQNSVDILPRVWNHYTLRRRGDRFTIFVNGVELEYLPPAVPGIVPVRIEPTNFAYGKRIGSAGNDTSLDWHGALDALRIYDRALSDAEIRDQYLHFSDVDPERSTAREVVRKYLANPPTIQTQSDTIRRIVPGDAASLDSFALTYGVGGSTIAVGAPDDDDNGSASGAVYFYEREGDTFRQLQKITPTEISANARFGGTAAVGGKHFQYAFVGAQSSGTFPAPGVMYVYERGRDGVWTELQKLQASNTTNSDSYGSGVVARGDYLVVGAPNHDQAASDGGAVFVYRRDGALFSEQAVLIASDVEPTDGTFGATMAMNDAADVLVVGAFLKKEGGANSGGAIYVFVRDGELWTEQAKLISDDRATGDNFGRFLAINSAGDMLAVGANNAGPGGAVYIFHCGADQQWRQIQKLTANDAAAGDRFGQAVAMYGGTLAVGAGEDDTGQGTESGSMYLYRLREGEWVFDRKYVPEEAATSAQYATMLAMDEEFVYVGNAPKAGTSANLATGVLFAIRHGFEARGYSQPRGYSYAETIEIEATLAAPLTATDYQTPITIDTATPISLGRMQPDGRDIAFFAADGETEVDHWIESGINSRETRVWLKLPTLANNVATKLVLRYGFPDGVSRSSVANTFVREVGEVRAAYTPDVDIGTSLEDVSGNGNSGTIFGPTWTAGPAPQTSALLFDGADDYVRIPRQPPLDITGDISISIWFRSDGLGTGAEAASNSMLVARQQTSGNSSYALILYHSTRTLELQLEQEGTVIIHRAASNTVINYGQWYHFVATYNQASGEALIYLDGQLDATHNFGSITIATPDLSLQLGAYVQTPDESVLRGFFTGAIGTVGIYAKTLSAAEIADQYANALYYSPERPSRELIRKTLKNPDEDALLFLSFNEGPGGTVTDQAGSGNTAVLSNAVWDSGSNGTALRFNGINGYARIPASWPAIGDGDFTIYAWINISALAGNHRLISADQSGNNFQFIIGDEGGGPVALEMYLGQSNTLKSNLLGWNTGQWYFVCAKRENGTLSFYRDAEFIGSVNGQYTVAASAFLDIGFRTTDGQHPFNGIIDEYRLYSRALSDTEIRFAFETRSLPLNAAIPVAVDVPATDLAIGDALAVPAAWNYRQTITLDNTAGGALSDYQQLLTVDTATLVREDKLRADCRDLLFVDEDGTSELNYWLESGANSEATRIWVKLPTIPGSTTRTIYMYYGNRATHARSSASGVFVREIPGLTLGLQMDEGAGAVLFDASGNKDSLTLFNVPRVAGQFGSAISFDGNIGYAIRNPWDRIPAEEITLEFWMRSADTTKQGAIIGYKLDPNPTGIDEMTFGTNTGLPGVTFQTNNNTAVGNAVVSDDLWHHVVVSWRGADGQVIFYKDGVETSRGTISVGYALPPGGALVLGQEQDTPGGGFVASQAYLGLMEGLRVYDRVLTPEEVADAAANYAFATPEYPGRTLVRAFAANEPTVSQSLEEEVRFNLPVGPYRLPIAIDRANETESLTDYQALFTVDTASLIAANKTAPDLSDVYFTAADTQTQLPFWIESGVNTANTRIWIRVPQIPAGESTTIYMYYGDAGAGGDSSAEGTFVNVVDGAIVYYSLDEGAGSGVRSLVGPDQPATVSGAAWSAGRYGNALTFDGVDDYLLQDGTFDFGLDEISFEFWVRPNGGSTNGNTLFSYSTALYANHIVVANPANIRFSVANVGPLFTGINIDDSQWHHIVVTVRNSDGQFLFYVDSERRYDINWGTGPVFQSGGRLAFGAQQTSPGGGFISGQYLNGQLDELRVYDRVLPPNEIRALMTNRVTPPIPGANQILMRRSAQIEPLLAPGGEEAFPFVAEQDGWPYRIPVTIDNSTGANALNDFQVAITLNTLGPISEGKMQLDGRDLLIADADAITQLPFWLEGPMNSANTKLWVRVPFIPANSQKTIYIFYGNSQATAQSNRASVFIREVPDVVAAYATDDINGATLPDLSGNGYDGAINGAATTAGRLGTALSFDGVDDFVSLPGFPGESVVGDFTIQLWARQTGFAANDRTYLLDARGDGGAPEGNDSVSMILDDVGGQVEVHHFIGWPSGGFTEYQSAIVSPVGQWTLHTIARVGSELRVYVNGVRIADDIRTDGSNGPPKNDPLSFAYAKRLGAWTSGVGGDNQFWFAGDMEAVRFYDRALSDAEILDLHRERGYVTTRAPGVELVRKFESVDPNSIPGFEENIPYQENSAQIRLSIDGIIESRSGGFRFPDGSVQLSASSGDANFPASYGILSESPYAPENFATNREAFETAIDFADWSPRPEMPFAVHAHSSVGLQGKLHVLGGRTDPGTLRADHLEYDPASRTWDVRVPMITARQYTQAITVGNRIHIMGGMTHPTNIISTDLHEFFDLSTGVWTAAAPLPEPLWTFMLSRTPDGNLHAIGGRSNSTTYLNVHYVYDPTEDAWFSAAPMPTVRGTTDSVVDDRGHIHVIGGYNAQGAGGIIERREHEVYDPGTDRWRTAPPLPVRREHQRIFLLNGLIYVFAGLSSSTTPATVEVFDLKTETWRTASAGGFAGYEFDTALVGDTLYTTGGYSSIGGANVASVLAKSFASPIHMHQRDPVPAIGGVVTIAAITSNSATLRWQPATGASGLNYRVYYSHEANIRTPQEMEANGIPVGPGVQDVDAALVPGLSTGTHYFNVLVEGEGASRAAYSMAGPVYID